MRLFIAINAPAAVRSAIFSDAAPLRAASDSIRWVAAHSLHLTLKFIGEWNDAAVDDVRRALAGAVSGHHPFDAETTAVGAFPNFRRPRVVWVGMTGEAKLRALASAVDAALAPLGVAAEARLFRAHLTLGRVRSELPQREAKALAQAAGGERARRAFPVRTVDLMRSELGPGGSRYTVVAEVPLHARGT